MATVTPDRTGLVDGEQCVVLRGVGWKGYSTVLRLRGERSYPRMVYLDGNLSLLSPSFVHERLKTRLGTFVMELVEGLDVPCRMAGSTTFRRKARRAGVEPDASFYLANADRIRGKTVLDLRRDPPPDLVVEASHTIDTDEEVEAYRRFGVPEVWIADERDVTFLVLSEERRYVPAGASATFPSLRAAEAADWVLRDLHGDDTGWARTLRRWVAEVLVPRREAMRQ